MDNNFQTVAKPLKRHPSLTELSRDHHHGLLLCWKIRQGLSKNIQPKRIKRYADYFFENHLESHFLEEEKYVFKLLGSEHPMITRALAEHARLRQLFSEAIEVEGALKCIEKELDAHIRFEERELFQEIQSSISEEELEKLAKKLKNPNESAILEAWPDKFWEKDQA